MTTTQKIALGSVGALAFFAVAGAGAFVSAQATTTTASSFMDRVAQIAGIDSQKLKDSFKQASKEQVEQKLKDGEITQEQAERIKEKIDSGEGYGPGFMKKGMKGPHGFGMVKQDMAAVAEYLGVSEAELREMHRDGKSLLEIAKEKGKSESDIRSFVSQKFDERLTQALKDGKLTQTQADTLKEKKTEIVNKMLSEEGPIFKGGHMR